MTQNDVTTVTAKLDISIEGADRLAVAQWFNEHISSGDFNQALLNVVRALATSRDDSRDWRVVSATLKLR